MDGFSEISSIPVPKIRAPADDEASTIQQGLSSSVVDTSSAAGAATLEVAEMAVQPDDQLWDKISDLIKGTVLLKHITC